MLTTFTVKVKGTTGIYHAEHPRDVAALVLADTEGVTTADIAIIGARPHGTREPSLDECIITPGTERYI